ncbi:MAG: DNA-3-methyladenine glycosylase 2 family protein [Bacteroidota bacterium]|nr:DNA-3-methyladenine glycosylase 2 family protein [Bacteroidota bacterium]
MKSKLPLPAGFNFLATVYSHGWCSLPPFSVEKETASLRAVIALNKRRSIPVRLESKDTFLYIGIESNGALSKNEKEMINDAVRAMLRLDESLDEFYTEASKHAAFHWVRRVGAGRMLRSQTVFEDVVKMICTTNCSWALTKTMVKNLVEKIGDGAFPSPEAIASVSEKFLRKEIRCGYRAPYLLELAGRVVSKELTMEEWRTSALPTEKLFERVRSVKGAGDYAAGNLMRLLGRYDYLALDSWCRAKFFKLHKNGRTVKDSTIEKFYAPFGKWRGLFFWLDVTKYWYEKQFPF